MAPLVRERGCDGNLIVPLLGAPDASARAADRVPAIRAHDEGTGHATAVVHPDADRVGTGFNGRHGAVPDPDQPVIMNAAPNSENLSVVNNRNASGWKKIFHGWSV